MRTPTTRGIRNQPKAMHARLFLVILMVLVMLTACRQAEDPDPEPGPTTGTLEFTITGLPNDEEPASPAVTVTGPEGYEQTVSETTTLPELEPGEYEIDAAPLTTASGLYAATVLGSPATVTAGETSSVTIEYGQVEQTGRLQVNVTGHPDDSEPQVYITGPDGYEQTLTTTTTLNTLSPGEYEVTAETLTVDGDAFDATVTGSPATVDIGETATINISYAATTGRLEVDVTGLPAETEADVTITGPDGFTQEITGNETLTGLTPGEYEIEAANIGTAEGSYEATVTDSPVDITAGTTSSVGVTYEAITPATPAVGTSTVYPTGASPWSVITPDLNDDGAPDLAVGNLNANTVSVLLNNGDGSFATANDYGVSSIPYDIAAGDMNGDENLDLVVSTGTGNIEVLVGAEDGTLAALSSYSVGGSLINIDAADLDGDGDVDVAVANQGASSVSVLLNEGDGSLAAPVAYSVGGSPRGLEGADVNGDGSIDLIATNESSASASVLLNNGEGTFATSTEYATGDRPADVVAVDFDGDGDTDLATANYQGGSITVLLNQGDGTFTEGTAYAAGSQTYRLATIDVGNDGVIDLVTTNYVEGSLSILVGNGDGTFAERVQFTTGPYAYAVATADFDGDGSDDIATTSLGNGSVYVHLTE